MVFAVLDYFNIPVLFVPL